MSTSFARIFRYFICHFKYLFKRSIRWISFAIFQYFFGQYILYTASEFKKSFSPNICFSICTILRFDIGHRMLTVFCTTIGRNNQNRSSLFYKTSFGSFISFPWNIQFLLLLMFCWFSTIFFEYIKCSPSFMPHGCVTIFDDIFKIAFKNDRIQCDIVYMCRFISISWWCPLSTTLKCLRTGITHTHQYRCQYKVNVSWLIKAQPCAILGSTVFEWIIMYNEIDSIYLHSCAIMEKISLNVVQCEFGHTHAMNNIEII